MTLRLQNLMLAMLLALTTLFVGFGALSQNPTSGGYQLFERAATGISADIPLASLEIFAPPPETASEYAIAPKGALTQIDTPVDLTNGRSGHILANHRAGAGKAGKTEFPSNWDDQRIIHQISDISTDPTLIRQVDNRGTPYVSGTRDGLDITVTFFPDSHPRAGQISSAYPTNVPYAQSASH